jgi:hypothetical protein
MNYILDEQLDKHEVFELSDLCLYYSNGKYLYMPVSFKLDVKIDLPNNFLIHQGSHNTKINYYNLEVSSSDNYFLYKLDINFFEMIQD